MSAPPIDAPKDVVADILAELDAAGVKVSVEDGRLKVNGPKGALTEARKTAIASNRNEIVARMSAGRLQASLDRGLRHVARTPPLPLSAVQKSFWFIDRIGQGLGIPSLITQLRLKGPIDFDALTAATAAALARHEILRLRIGDRDGEPYPEIRAAPEDLVTVADLTALPEAERERAGERLSKAFMSETFNLVTGPLAKVSDRSDFAERRCRDPQYAPYRRRRVVFVDSAGRTRSALFGRDARRQARVAAAAVPV